MEAKSKAGLNLEFFISLTGCLTKAKEPSLLSYLTTSQGRTDGFMPFQSLLASSETQTSLPWILPWVADSISYDDSCYIKYASYVISYYLVMKINCKWKALSDYQTLFSKSNLISRMN